jgi:hypothetical protein
LLVRFVPFSKMTDWAANLSPDVLAPPSFTEEKNSIDLSIQLSEILGKRDDPNNFLDTSDNSDKLIPAKKEPTGKEPILCVSTATSEGAIV